MEPTSVLKLPTGDHKLVTANYNKISDHIRRLTPQGIQCSVFCGGTNCKYENPENWTADSLAIQGLYSHWITDNVLAMARPSTVVIIQKNIMQQFLSLGIKSIINLQCPNEHASCGQQLESSGFSYDPNVFMENNIYYYNFAWKDYGDASLIALLNMVKVVAFAVTEGRVAIHCHAGLGRTGVLIACYLVYSLRVPANAAIKYVRLKRPGSVQTRGQISCVRHFAHYILPNLLTFYIKDYSSKDSSMTEFTLSRFLKRQKIALHGYEERNYKHFPKIIHKICERILKLSGCWMNDFPPSNIPFTKDFLLDKMGVNVQRHESMYSICSNIDELSLLSPASPSSNASDNTSMSSAPPSPNPLDNTDLLDTFSEIDEECHEDLLYENKCFQELEIQKSFDQHKIDEDPIELHDIREVIDVLIMMDSTTLSPKTKCSIRHLQNEINSSQLGWMKLDMLNDIMILIALLYDWLESLKKPILDRNNLEVIVIHYMHVESCLNKIEKESAFLIEYLLIFISKLHIPQDLESEVLKRMLAAMTHQYVVIQDRKLPSGREFKKFRDGTSACAMQFLKGLLRLVEIHHRAKVSGQMEYSDNLKSDEDSDTEIGFHESNVV